MLISIKDAAPIIEKELKSTISNSESILAFFSKNINALGDVVLFGGAIRDIILLGELQEGSDLDFVVRCDRRVLADVVDVFKPKINKFGGFRFGYGNRCVDVWSLEDTWAIKNGYTKSSGGLSEGGDPVMMDLLDTTFFNIDSVYYRISTKHLICSKKFLDGVRAGILSINLQPNPSAENIVKRAQRMKDEKGLELDSRLGRYVSSKGNIH